MTTERLYHLVALPDRTGPINERIHKKIYLTSHPMTHAECVVMKGRFSAHPARRIQLEEAAQ